MILESFEIENWSCIARLAVKDLPATGVVVLYGPNRTGKSSIQGQLQLKPCADYYFQQELLIPAATTALHYQAVLARMLF
jgi:predicted ATPase